MQIFLSHHREYPISYQYISIAGIRPMKGIVLSPNLYIPSLYFAEHCMRSHVKCLVPMEGRVGKNNWHISTHLRSWPNVFLSWFRWLNHNSFEVKKMSYWHFSGWWFPLLSKARHCPWLPFILSLQPQAAWDREGNPAWQAPGCQRAGKLPLQLLATKRTLEGILGIADQQLCLLMAVESKKIKPL